MNRDFEFRQLLRAYRSGVITEETFEQEMANLETGAMDWQMRPMAQLDFGPSARPTPTNAKRLSLSSIGPA